MGDAFGGIGGAVSGLCGVQQADGQLSQQAYQIGNYLTSGTITLSPSNWGYTIAPPAPAPPAVKKLANEAWLDQRIEEMRVKL